MIALGGPASEKGGPERAYAKEAFSAAKDDDEDGFIEALLNTIRACAKKSYSDDAEPDGDEE